MPRFPLLPLVLAALGACRYAPAGPIPDPLPETLEWARPSAGQGAFLGLEVRENTGDSLEALSFEDGARVAAVAAGSPAAGAGIAVGDVLLRFDGVTVADPATLSTLLQTAEGGHEARLEVRRGDATFEVAVTLRAGQAGASEPPPLLWRADPARSLAGWRAGRGGVVLVTQDPDGPFARAGFAPGTVVLALDGEPQRAEQGLLRALQAKAPGARALVRARPAGEDEVVEREVRLYRPARRLLEATVPVLVGYRASADGEQASFYLVDLWFLSLFRYRREGAERHYSFLRFFTYASGVGQLEEGAR